MRRTLAIVMIMALTACTTQAGDSPSLAKRPAESIDPRLPVGSAPDEGQTAIVAAEIAVIENEARDGIAAFDQLRAETGSAVAAAGEPNSESWVNAIEALSRLEAARRPLVDALADLDALVANRVSNGSWVSKGDRDAVEAAVARLSPIDAQQAALLQDWSDALQP